jgi:hypothetical protein
LGLNISIIGFKLDARIKMIKITCSEGDDRQSLDRLGSIVETIGISWQLIEPLESIGKQMHMQLVLYEYLRSSCL